MEEHSESSKILSLDTVPSTNLYVKENYKLLDDNTLVVARYQTAGRGRRGRTWISNDDGNIYATLLIKDVKDVAFAGSIVGLAGLATLREFAPEVNFYLKWPNDIYLEKSKISGILCESCEFSKGKITAIACGIGINLNLSENSLNLIEQAATSLNFVTNRNFNSLFFAERLAFFTNRYYIMYRNNFLSFISEWKSNNFLIGQKIGIIDSHGTYYFGTFEDIGENGELLLNCEGDVELGVFNKELTQSTFIGRKSFLAADVSLDKSTINFK